ncbi:hypothetical protein BDN72DRAFT_590788 [Pluteus cervinus]|uniref:Uncharacterized protein n=1 Tax=Pluteus cervinus TaxID=181527 RepID=A0ACD3A1T3_9AGAR|nr:hypothetical protein BDN72DRAFT_590788 [Pluteus cervinus]
MGRLVKRGRSGSCRLWAGGETLSWTCKCKFARFILLVLCHWIQLVGPLAVVNAYECGLCCGMFRKGFVNSCGGHVTRTHAFDFVPPPRSVDN